MSDNKIKFVAELDTKKLDADIKKLQSSQPKISFQIDTSALANVAKEFKAVENSIRQQMQGLSKSIQSATKIPESSNKKWLDGLKSGSTITSSLARDFNSSASMFDMKIGADGVFGLKRSLD